MRGSQKPALKNLQTETQQAFAELSRHRRSHLAKAAQTTLVKASQWARGEAVLPEIASALESNVKKLLAKKK